MPSTSASSRRRSGMLFLPFLRRVGERWIRFFMAVTIGCSASWPSMPTSRAPRSPNQEPEPSAAPSSCSSVRVPHISAWSRWIASLRARDERAREAGASAFQLSLLIAIGIGLHNLGEGLAIGIRLRHR